MTDNSIFVTPLGSLADIPFFVCWDEKWKWGPASSKVLFSSEADARAFFDMKTRENPKAFGWRGVLGNFGERRDWGHLAGPADKERNQIPQDKVYDYEHWKPFDRSSFQPVKAVA
jgi:hypothetical protein